MPWSPLKGGWLTGKMNRETGSAPAGSRVATQTKDGVKNEAGPNWNDLASKDKTWNILDKLREIGKSNKKTVSQVASGGCWKRRMFHQLLLVSKVYLSLKTTLELLVGAFLMRTWNNWTLSQKWKNLTHKMIKRL